MGGGKPLRGQRGPLGDSPGRKEGKSDLGTAGMMSSGEAGEDEVGEVELTNGSNPPVLSSTPSSGPLPAPSSPESQHGSARRHSLSLTRRLSEIRRQIHRERYGGVMYSTRRRRKSTGQRYSFRERSEGGMYHREGGEERRGEGTMREDDDDDKDDNDDDDGDNIRHDDGFDPDNYVLERYEELHNDNLVPIMRRTDSALPADTSFLIALWNLICEAYRDGHMAMQALTAFAFVYFTFAVSQMPNIGPSLGEALTTTLCSIFAPHLSASAAVGVRSHFFLLLVLFSLSLSQSLSLSLSISLSLSLSLSIYIYTKPN